MGYLMGCLLLSFFFGLEFCLHCVILTSHQSYDWLPICSLHSVDLSIVCERYGMRHSLAELALRSRAQNYYFFLEFLFLPLDVLIIKPASIKPLPLSPGFFFQSNVFIFPHQGIRCTSALKGILGRQNYTENIFNTCPKVEPKAAENNNNKPPVCNSSQVSLKLHVLQFRTFSLQSSDLSIVCEHHGVRQILLNRHFGRTLRVFFSRDAKNN